LGLKCLLGSAGANQDFVVQSLIYLSQPHLKVEHSFVEHFDGPVGIVEAVSNFATEFCRAKFQSLLPGSEFILLGREFILFGGEFILLGRNLIHLGCERIVFSRERVDCGAQFVELRNNVALSFQDCF